ncbi:MAG: hypothetical protein ACK5DD_13940 [Cyclobacteriaceae bacterium]|jgi:hypothetical protein
MSKRFKSFEKELDLKADIYKTELDKDLELYKKDLNLDLTKREKLHERRLDILGELYTKLVDLDFAMMELVQIFKTVVDDFDDEERERIDKAGAAYNEFFKILQRKIKFTFDRRLVTYWTS